MKITVTVYYTDQTVKVVKGDAEMLMGGRFALHLASKDVISITIDKDTREKTT